MTVDAMGARSPLPLLALAVFFVQAGPAGAWASGTPTERGEAPPVSQGEAPFAPDLPLESWDDDWTHPEGTIKIAGFRYSLVLGGILTRWTRGETRRRYGSTLFDPHVDLYRPQGQRWLSSLDILWTGFLEGDESVRLLAPTFGPRVSLVEARPSRRLVPFAALRVGPYFVRGSDLGSHTVIGGNATFGLEVRRRVFLALRYDVPRRVQGIDLSNWSATLAFRVPIGKPAATVRRKTDTLPPPGELVDVGGYRLHLVCRGEGSPTVVLEAGMSDAWVTWTRVQSALAKTTRVCSYDRAGIGYSDPGPTPRTSGQIVKELHTLLQAARVEGPYVLVGHSFGGFNVRLFASRHPDEVAGLVLVDASHEDQWGRYPPQVREQMTQFSEGVRQMAERAERGQPTPPVVPNLPPDVASRPAWYRTLFEEYRSVEDSAAELRAAERSLRVPLVVISAGRPPRIGRTRVLRAEMRRVGEEMQAEMTRLSPQGTRVVARKSGHYVQRSEPELVVGAIEEMVRALRARVPERNVQ